MPRSRSFFRESRHVTVWPGCEKTASQPNFMLRSAIVLFFLSLLPARANLGETVEQCVARYGAPAGYSEASPKFPFGTIVFSSTGYTLVIFVSKDKEVGARVSKQDKSAFSEVEMKTIMGADSGGTSWTSAPSPDPTCLRWIRNDEATALYDKDKRVLIFSSLAMEAAIHPAAPEPAASH
jgi:hypothetical protein